MKYISILLSLILCGCIIPEIQDPTPPKTIRNPECLNAQKMEILQVNDDMTLVYLYWSYRYGNTINYQRHPVIYAIKTAGFNNKAQLYDGSIMEFENTCAGVTGTYSYVNSAGARATVQEITVLAANIPNPAYEEWVKNQETTADEPQSDN